MTEENQNQQNDIAQDAQQANAVESIEVTATLSRDDNDGVAVAEAPVQKPKQKSKPKKQKRSAQPAATSSPYGTAAVVPPKTVDGFDGVTSFHSYVVEQRSRTNADGSVLSQWFILGLFHKAVGKHAKGNSTASRIVAVCRDAGHATMIEQSLNLAASLYRGVGDAAGKAVDVKQAVDQLAEKFNR